MNTITLPINTPAPDVIAAINAYAANKFKKATATIEGDTITITQKVLWQTQTTTFTATGTTLTGTSDVSDAQSRMYKIAHHLADNQLLDDRGWHEAANRSDMRKALGTGEQLRTLTQLHDGETVHAVTIGVEGGKRQVVVCTSVRVILFENTLTNSGSKTITLDKISSVSAHRGTLHSEMKFTTSNGEIKVEKMLVSDGEMFVNTVRKLMDAPAVEPISTPAAGVDLEQLQKLSELHAAGVLTDDEFAAAKAKALGL